MSKTNSLHYDLCVEGAKWLRRRQNYDRCKAKKPCFSPELCRAAERETTDDKPSAIMLA